MILVRAAVAKSIRIATVDYDINRINNMEVNESVCGNLATAISQALKGFVCDNDNPVVTDIHLKPLRDSGELVICDDDNVLSRSRIAGFTEWPETEFLSLAEEHLRKAMSIVNSRTPLELLDIWKPYSVVMADEDGETLAELMLIDDETQLVSQTLLANLDEELDQFLRDLMSE